MEFSEFAAELVERPYIALGAIALVGLLMLAVTSTRWSMRKLGKRWKKLHRIVYPTLIVVLLHMLWVVRSDVGQWSLYATIAAILLSARLPAVERKLAKVNAGRRSATNSKESSKQRLT